MSKQTNVRTVTVRFRQSRSNSRHDNVANSGPYTYLIPAGVDIDVGDEVVVPVGRYGHTRRATVTEVGTLDYKYVLGKVVLLSDVA